MNRVKRPTANHPAYIVYRKLTFEMGCALLPPALPKGAEKRSRGTYDHHRHAITESRTTNRVRSQQRFLSGGPVFRQAQVLRRDSLPFIPFVPFLPYIRQPIHPLA